MFEHILLLKIDKKFHRFFVSLFLVLYYLCLYNALHTVGAQIFEEGGRKQRKEGRIQTAENFLSETRTLRPAIKFSFWD